ncbi:MAG: Gfo/Idh/MocA family protein [Isosphaerales bacterium]
MSSPFSRRDFTKAALLGAAAGAAPTAARAGRVIGANDRVRIACIGVGYRGVQDLHAFLAQKDAQIVALCDVYEPYLNGQFDKIHPHFKELTHRVPSGLPDFGGPVERHKDFRRILDKKDVDAVIVATPDHWHAVQTIMACDAGKDVYVEKPLSLTVREGRRMVEAARRNNRVVQVGTQRRSSKLYAQLAGLVGSGAIGKVTVARAGLTDNMTPNGIGKVADSAPPEGLDWDLWLGPRPERPFNLNLLPYKFRWWNLYSSQMANWGAHFLDAMRWCTRETAPASISAHGGVYAVNDCRTIPDTAEVIFEHASGMLTIFSTFEASGQPLLRTGEIELRGTLGTVYASMNRIEIIPERGGAFQDPKPRIKPLVLSNRDGYGELDRAHARNFLDCVKSRERPVCDVEEGHRSTSYALLANIALATKARLDWDAHSERFTNNDAANELLDYEYRQPWSHV